MTEYHVLCSRPGLHRGGRANPAHAAYRPGDHTPAQLRALLEEPEVVVVIGTRLAADHIGVLEEMADQARQAAEGGAAERPYDQVLAPADKQDQTGASPAAPAKTKAKG